MIFKLENEKKDCDGADTLLYSPSSQFSTGDVTHSLSPSFAYLVSPYPLPKLVGSLARLDVIIKVYNCYDLNQVGPQYLYSLFRSLVSMTTVGTGKKVTPKTTTSFLFCIFTYLCGVLIFATIVGNAADMVVDLRRHREKYHKKVS